MQSRNLRTTVASLAIIAGASTSHMVWAAAASAPAVEVSNEGLEEITVTARKTRETLVDVPLAITAITAKAIDQKGITDIFQVAQFTPGFRFQNQAVGRNDRGFKQYVMRGMVPNSALATRQAVTLFVDGAPVSGGNINGVSDIERIETVKGPQSAFFGRATFAGAINFITRAPSYEWGGNASVQYERFGTVDANASVEGPIVDEKLAFRLSGRYYDTKGTYSNVGNPGERLGARNTKSVSLTLLAEPTDTLKVRVFGTKWNDSDGLPANVLYGEESQNCTVPGSPRTATSAPSGPVRYICGKLPSTPAAGRTWGTYIDPLANNAVQNGSTLYGANFINHLGLERDAIQLRMMADWDINDFTVSGIGSYGKNKWGFLQSTFGVDVRNVPNPSFNGTTLPFRNQYSLTLGNTQDQDKYGEIRIASPSDKRIKAMIGTNYYYGKTDNLTSGYNASSGYSLFTPHTINRSKTYGVFGSVNWEFIDRFNLSVEGRYQVDKLFQQTLSGTNPQYADEFKSFSPRAIVSYKPTSDSSVYASYSIGNRPGEFNTIFRTLTPSAQSQIVAVTGGVAEAVPEDKVKMGEIGYKGMMFDNRLRILASAYYGVWSNRHVPNIIPYYNNVDAAGNPLPGEVLRSVQLTNSNGKVQLKGIELEGALRASEELTIESTFSMADTKIKRTGCTDCTALISNSNPVGNQLPSYPKFSGTFSATYEKEVIEGYKAFIRGDAIYTGRMYDTEANLNYTAQSVIFNARVGVEFDSYKVEVFGRNLSNNKTPTSFARGSQSIYNTNGTIARTVNGITASLPEPVVYGMKLTAKF